MTALKLLKANTKSAVIYEDLFMVMYAQLQYLQDEYTALVVQSSFDPAVSRFFRSLQRNSSFTPGVLQKLHSAATIAAAYKSRRGRLSDGRSEAFCIGRVGEFYQ